MLLNMELYITVSCINMRLKLIIKLIKRVPLKTLLKCLKQITNRILKVI